MLCFARLPLQTFQEGIFPIDALASLIFLYGPPGTGKRTIGRLLASDLNLPFVDLGEVVEARSAMPLRDLLGREGEAGLRVRESQVLDEVLARRMGVVALGDGTLLDSGDRKRVEAAGPILCLQATAEVLQARLESTQRDRSSVPGGQTWHVRDLLAQRARHYASFPLQISTDPATTEQAAWEAQIQSGYFHVRGMGAGYGVRVIEGGIDALGEALQGRELQGPLAMVSDENVAALYGSTVLETLERAGFSVQTIILPAGESQKTLRTVERVWRGLLEAGVERQSAVLGLGGGVIGDLTGFAAATFLKGVAWVSIPTTLLAMVDASLGGKTGVDLPRGKNLVGAFHPPALVLADPRLLDTLPEAEWRSGMAEVVKHGVIADTDLFRLCAGGWSGVHRSIGQLVRRAMAVKIQIIQSDPLEGGAREALNLGHTIGHALEHASAYRLRHGEAIAIGMVVEASLAERLGLAEPGLSETIARVLQGLDLPTRIPPGLDREAIVHAMLYDKKRRQGTMRFTLPRRVGEVQVGVEVTDLRSVI